MGNFKLGAAVVLAVCVAGCTRPCTLIGCEDSLTLEVRWPDGGPVERFRGEITLDDQATAFECPASQEVYQQYHCEGAGTVYVSLTWMGRTGSSRPIGGSPPPSLPVSIEAGDGGLIWSRVLTPSYEELAPNGPGCGPTCKRHHEVVKLEPR